MGKTDENWLREWEKKRQKEIQEKINLRLEKFSAIERYLLDEGWLKTEIPFGLGYQKDNIIFIFDHSTGIAAPNYEQFTALGIYLTPDTKVPEQHKSKDLEEGYKKDQFRLTPSGFWVREYNIKESNVLNAFEYRVPLNKNESWKQVLGNKEMEIKQLLSPSS